MHSKKNIKMKLILLRHGESQWNLENRFTGWKDVSLTDKGKQEAIFSANQILKENIYIDSIFTSLLNRATQTTKIVTTLIKFDENNINYDWRLNERHYGALEGLNKSETAKKYGEDQVHIWRRSYDIPPPLLSPKDKRNPNNNLKFMDIEEELPLGESLKDVVNRLQPFLEYYFSFISKNPGNHLIVAHSNSLRAIIKVLKNYNDKEITGINIPTGVPLVYDLKSNLEVIEERYLIDENELIKKQDLIKKQGKAN